eukprot:1331303-Amphidinium_carterae.1
MVLVRKHQRGSFAKLEDRQSRHASSHKELQVGVMEHGTRERCLAAVMRDGVALADAAEIHKADKEIVLAAVGENGRSLRFAADSLKSDREIVLAAVKKH